ncbi:sigma factor-like helix-turn-helix DNA-binding protein [Clostridium massiliamazoniense]|uniref:sigma factor-like helix-turn-helix DNA-binding protein n=1 Tax=Clostridium massiliamazoniense TaxID=1347366 RepID=UPI0006D79453|nr:sigma factor-like helix-turn-helix DNA-binding protein [Clostridium massiliamazoniense]
MIVKNILEEYRENKRRLIFLEKELQYINKNTEDIGAVQLTEKTGVTNKVNNNIENKYIRKEVEIESIVNEINYLKYVIELAEFYISIADTEEEQDLLKYRYQSGWKMSRIATRVNLSESGVRMKLERALKKIDKIVDLNNMKYIKGLGA